MNKLSYLCLMGVVVLVMTIGMTTPAVAAPQEWDFLLTQGAPDAHNAVALARLAVIGDDSFMRGASLALIVATLGIVIALRRK
jgi:hypothetical protein